MFPNPLPYSPQIGEVLLCDFSNLVPPEMEKKRFIVVVSPRLRHRKDLWTVVPISTTEPEYPQPFHVKLAKDPKPNSYAVAWVKCDMIMAVSNKRLSAYYEGRTPTGKRNYVTLRVSNDDLRAIRGGILHSLALGGLQEHL